MKLSCSNRERYPYGSGKDAGFTLIELLAVIGIVLLLAALLSPALIKAIEKGRGAKCAANLRQLYLGAKLYENDSGQPLMTFNAGGAWDAVLYQTLNIDRPTDYSDLPRGPFACPSCKAVYAGSHASHYGKNVLINNSTTAPQWKGNIIPEPSRLLFLADAKVLAVADGSERCVRDLSRFAEGGNLGYRHSGRANVIFHDGHGESVDYDGVLNLGWYPTP